MQPTTTSRSNPSSLLLQPSRPTTATTSAGTHSPPPSTSSRFLAPHATPFTPAPPDLVSSSTPLPHLNPVFSRHAQLRGTVRIRVEATTFFCHREVLMLASPFFEAVLQGGWRETAPRTPRKAKRHSADSKRASFITTRSTVSVTTSVDPPEGDAAEGGGGGGAASPDLGQDDSASEEGDVAPSLAASFLSSVGAGDDDEDDEDADDETIVCRLKLMEERASSFQDLLMHIYPRLECSITWQNVGDLCRMASKFDMPSLRSAAIAFLLPSAAGNPILSLKIAEDNMIPELYKEASRYVLDNVWPQEELQMLSQSTLLKLERRRSWFLERLLKLGLVQTSRDYVCQATCVDPTLCARLLDEKWRSAWSSAFRFGTPQPSIIYRSLRNLEPSLSSPALHLPHTACQSHARLYVADLFDRMFQQSIIPARNWATLTSTGASGAARTAAEGVTKSSARYFLWVEMDGTPLKKPSSHAQNAQHQQQQQQQQQQ